MKKPIAALIFCLLIVLSLYIPPFSASSAVAPSPAESAAGAVSSNTPSSDPAADSSSDASSATTSAASSEESSLTVGSSAAPSEAPDTPSESPSQIASEDAQAVTDLTNTYEELQKKVEELQAEKDRLSREQKDVTKYIKALDNQIDATNRQLNMLNDEIDELNGELESLTAHIAEVEGNIVKTLEIFKKRLRAIYMSGNATEISLLLSSDNFVDFLTRAEILKRISDYDQKIVNLLKADKAELETLVVNAETARQSSQNKKVSAASKKKELNTQFDEQEEYLDKLKEDKEAYEAYIKQYEEEMEEAHKEIEAILAKYKSADEYVGGAFAWPLPGFTKITSPYGSRSSGFHTGTDIAGRNAAGELCYGYPVVAANSGTVIAVRNLGSKSYGRYIILDHGGGCRTLYAHLSKTTVKEGDTVTRGQEIGKAGSTGNSTGPHLHFELWLDNARVNPMAHLKIPK